MSASLKRILEHPYVAATRLCERRRAFVHANRRLKGLHRLLDRDFPFEAHDARACTQCSARRTRHSRRLTLGVRERDRRATRRSSLVRLATRANQCTFAGGDREHGSQVDAALDAYVRTGRFARDADACARALVARLAELGWRVAASQVPLYSPSQRFGSAIDVLAIADDDDRLALVEVKASLQRQRASCYATSPRLARDVEQARRLARALASDVGERVDATLLVRVSDRALRVSVFECD